ncbi:TetR/AcrR family transcriptional regulator [bacterium SCSIO 12643]|nr:TetR/AcrR family transcriptional regulator [bacterium SCSIO 12643]
MPKIVAQKEDWIQLGYELFSNQGISGIVIEKMAKQLVCNKSSFYWHFKSKKEFIHELIQFWIRIETEQVIQRTENASTPQEKLEQFLTIAFKNDPYLEFIYFLKRYASNKPEIQKIIDEVDQRRLSFTSQLFQELGYPQKEASIKADIFYKYLIGYHEMIKNKKQPKNYLKSVKSELKHFLDL